jgi:hypothetical protein
MPPTYAQNKVHIYKWRETNHEKHNEMSAKYMVRCRSWKKIQKVFLNILL